MTAVLQLDENVTAALDRAIAAGIDLSPAMREIAGHLEAETRLRFETGTGPDGRAWEQSRRVIEHGGKTLVESGDLKSSIGSAFGADFAEAGPERSFGAAVYAAIHQFGGTIRAIPKSKGGAGALKTPFGARGSIRMPARPFLGFGPGDGDEIGRILTVHLSTAFGSGATA